MDDQDEIAEEVPKKDPKKPAHPVGGGGEPKARDEAEVAPADVVPGADPAERLEPAPRLYRLRAPGLRPVHRPPRGRRAGRLRADCPPDERGSDEDRAEPRYRLR
jgi:hypothetical protein